MKSRPETSKSHNNLRNVGNRSKDSMEDISVTVNDMKRKKKSTMKSPSTSNNGGGLLSPSVNSTSMSPQIGGLSWSRRRRSSLIDTTVSAARKAKGSRRKGKVECIVDWMVVDVNVDVNVNVCNMIGTKAETIFSRICNDIKKIIT